MHNFFVVAAASAEAASQAAGSGEAASGGIMGAVGQFLPFILIIAVFYLFLIRPQKKREKQAQEMRSAIDVGDEIITAGGIIGTVILVKDDYMVLETGSDRSKIRVARWAVQANNTPKESTSSLAAEEKKEKGKDKDDE